MTLRSLRKSNTAISPYLQERLLRKRLSKMSCCGPLIDAKPGHQGLDHWIGLYNVPKTLIMSFEFHLRNTHDRHSFALSFGLGGDGCTALGVA